MPGVPSSLLCATNLARPAPANQFLFLPFYPAHPLTLVGLINSAIISRYCAVLEVSVSLSFFKRELDTSREPTQPPSRELNTTMSDFQNYGGSEEDNAEIRKLNAEVVCHHLSINSCEAQCCNDADLVFVSRRRPTPTASKPGRSWCALAKASRAV